MTNTPPQTMPKIEKVGTLVVPVSHQALGETLHWIQTKGYLHQKDCPLDLSILPEMSFMSLPESPGDVDGGVEFFYTFREFRPDEDDSSILNVIFDRMKIAVKNEDSPLRGEGVSKNLDADPEFYHALAEETVHYLHEEHDVSLSLVFLEEALKEDPAYREARTVVELAEIVISSFSGQGLPLNLKS